MRHREQGLPFLFSYHASMSLRTCLSALSPAYLARRERKAAKVECIDLQRVQKLGFCKGTIPSLAEGRC